MKKIISLILMALILLTVMCSCDLETARQKDTKNTLKNANTLQSNQPTPTDIDYSLERYNLIKRTYWVNGQREKALSIPCAVERPLGYCVLIAEGGAILGCFEVDGKVSSLNSFLTPNSEYYGCNGVNEWLPDVDGSYGENDNGIFFFTTDGNYIEWTGTYLYSDIPFKIDTPVINVKGE